MFGILKIVEHYMNSCAKIVAAAPPVLLFDVCNVFRYFQIPKIEKNVHGNLLLTLSFPPDPGPVWAMAVAQC
jgi:hypothetical protein